MNEERLFLSIGSADPALLKRSGRRHAAPTAKWGLLAACLVLLCTTALLAYRCPPPALPPDDGPVEHQPSEVLTFTGGDVGTLHLEAICYSAEERSDFSLYVNEERYSGVWEDGSYVVRPITPTPEGLPACDLTVSHWRNISLAGAMELVRANMVETYSMVLDPEEYADRITLSAYDGTESGAEWDAANVRVTLVDDREGGVFTLAARFFTEAAEGLGADFAGMAGTFQPIPSNITVPAWLASLRETIGALLSAVFSNDWTETGGLLAEDAQVFGYQENVSAQMSISAIDVSASDSEDPTSVTVSVRHRLSTEEPIDELIIELYRIDGQWKAQSIRLEH